MVAKVEPKSGLSYGWSLGENNWNTGMDANLLRIGRLAIAPYVLSRTITTPPTAAYDGDMYIIPAGATGIWTGMEGRIATYMTGGWDIYQPVNGGHVVIAEEQVLCFYIGNTWTQGIPL